MPVVSLRLNADELRTLEVDAAAAGCSRPEALRRRAFGETTPRMMSTEVRADGLTVVLDE